MKKTLLLLTILLHVNLFAGFLDDLIGKDKSFLTANGFKCTEFSCITKDQKYFNLKLLDDTVSYVEVYSTDKDEVYKIAFYLHQNDKLKNKEMDEAFYKALVKLNEKAKLVYEMTKVSDKFGDEALITMTDAKKASAYVGVLREMYLENMKKFIENGNKN